MNKKAKVESIEKVSAKVIKIRFKLTEPTSIEFKPGQFVSMKVDTMIRRSYSIASAPFNTEFIDLYNDVMPGGPGSKYWLKLKVGDEAEFLGPLGIFKYVEGSNKPVIFIATNTGIAPFYSMIVHALESERSTRPIYLYFGVRYEEDIFMNEEFEELAKKFENFKYKLSLTRPEENWTGLKGRVTELIEKDFDSLKGYEAYICGGQAMIASTEELLLTKGMDIESIYYEKFY
jgi:NAD(P)H-flavin reductase